MYQNQMTLYYIHNPAFVHFQQMLVGAGLFFFSYSNMFLFMEENLWGNALVTYFCLENFIPY